MINGYLDKHRQERFFFIFEKKKTTLKELHDDSSTASPRGRSGGTRAFFVFQEGTNLRFPFGYLISERYKTESYSGLVSEVRPPPFSPQPPPSGGLKGLVCGLLRGLLSRLLCGFCVQSLPPNLVNQSTCERERERKGEKKNPSQCQMWHFGLLGGFSGGGGGKEKTT